MATGRVLREFLYVDLPKVRGLLAQLDEGIFESEMVKNTESKTSLGGAKGLFEHRRDWGDETTSQKSLGDALFPTLESALESEGALFDLSAELLDPGFWPTTLPGAYPAGSLVRITSQGYIFDSRLVADALSNFATATIGLQNIGSLDAPASPPLIPPKAKGKRPAANSVRRATPPEWPQRPLEERIPADFSFSTLDGKQLQGIVQVARGIYSPGLSLGLTPTDDPRCVVHARLEEGRAFLDSEPDVLFARFGVETQQWTIVGTVGHYPTANIESMDSAASFIDDEGDVIRSKFGQYVNYFIKFLAQSGFADLPQRPSFSLVPIAVYRVLNPAQIGSELAVSE